MLINKQAFHDSTKKDFKMLPNNTTAVGIDYNLNSKDNRWFGKFFYHRSFNEHKKDSAYASTAKIIYSKPNIRIELLAQAIGANFDPQVGYLPGHASIGLRRKHIIHGIEIKINQQPRTWD